jgi:protein-S-isoprenylcysteine O-methyltransferase Ste14
LSTDKAFKEQKMDDRHASPPGRSQVIVFPPVIPIAGFALGVVLEHVMPIGALIAGTPRTLMRGIGGLVFVIGAAGFAWMIATMKRAHTPIHNAQTPTTLVETGPFRFSRNPMYLCGSIAYAGLALLFLQIWPLALLPVVAATTHYGVVLREEAFLERRFGDAYRRYKARVSRYW